MKPPIVTKRERQIMNIFWNSDKPLLQMTLLSRKQDL